MKNIVMIGMPGSGKTTIASLLAEKLQKQCIDIDAYIVEKYKMTIPQMFAISEAYFRERESICCREIMQLEDCVISAGGGIIKNPDNIRTLKEHGIVIYLDRTVVDIMQDVEIQNRPLLKEGPEVLYQLYQERHPMYIEASHIIVENKGNMEEVVENIVKQIMAIRGC